MNTPHQQRILYQMCFEVRETFTSVIGSFYRDRNINLDDVNINDDEYMDNLVDIALEHYSNGNDYVMEFENMQLWDNFTNKTEAFGIAINYIITNCRDNIDADYNIPVEYFTEYNHNRIRVLFQYIYLSNNRSIVEQLLIDVYNQQLEEEEE